MPASRRCMDCGTLVPARPGGRTPARCPGHQRARQQAKDAKRPERRTSQAIQSNAQLVADHRLRYGDWCPGVPTLGRLAHPAADLTADHLLAVADGGSEHGPRVVRCRPCNSARGAPGDAGLRER